MGENSSYRQIVKATSIFGGVQVFQIMISIVRSKIVAVLVGSTGFGVMGLLTSTTGLISSLTNFGLGTSAVRNVAEAYGKEDKDKVSIIVAILHKFVIITGLLGTFIALIFSPLLSEYTFGNRKYTFSFILIAVTLFLTQLGIEKSVLLQGSRSIKYLAKAGVTGSLLGLIISTPIYYFLRLDGIVPSIIISSVMALLMSWYYVNKIDIKHVNVSISYAFKEGKDMLFLGLMLSLSLIITQITSYIIRIYIRQVGGIEQVGLYVAGFSIINNYVGMIFSAMATEYYPRLSCVSNDMPKATIVINQQAEITLLILAPILVLFVSFANFGVQLLYSNQFMGINLMLQWAALGMFFKGASFAIAHLFLAKGASKLFFINEAVANSYILLFNICGYKYGGLEGIGVSFLAGYFLYFIQVLIVAKKKYQYRIGKSFVEILLVQFMLSFFCFVSLKVIPLPYSYISIIIFISILLYISISAINKRLNLVELISKYKRK